MAVAATTTGAPKYGKFDPNRAGGAIKPEFDQGMQSGWKDYSDDYLQNAYAYGSQNQGFSQYGQSALQALNARRHDAEAKANLDKLSPIPAPKRDPRVIALMNSQRDLAKRFRAGMGGNIESEYGEYQRDRGRQLAGEREGIDASFNSRGLLRSGMHEGASVDAGAQATKDLQSKRLEIGDRYRETADQLDDEPLQTEIALAGGAGNVGQAANQANQEFQKLVLENRQNRQNALESAFGAGGYFLGAAAAKGGSSPYASAGAWSPGAVQGSGAYNPFMDYYMGAE